MEATAGYGVYTHGEAVMIGMIYALHISKKYADWISSFFFRCVDPQSWL
ncbi:hypothetical protein ACI2OX_10760 [Bacillus sp. N9]